MAARNLIAGNFYQLLDTALNEVDEFRPCSNSKFKLCFSSKDVNIDDIEGRLIEFQ